MIMEGNCNNQLNNAALNGIVFNLHDVTEKRMALEKVMQNEKIYRAVAANIPGTAIMIFDEHYNYSVVEGEILNVFGYSKTALTGKNISEVLEPEMRRVVTGHLDKVFAGEAIEVKMKVGDYDLITNYVPLKDDDQKVFSAMVVVTDVSGLTKAERQISQMNVILEKKVKDRTLQLEGINRELEAFTYSVSHDLRAPLRIIDGFANMVTEDYGGKLDDEANRMLKVIKNNAQKMGQLIDDLLKLSRVGKQEIVPVLADMESIVQNVIEEINELYSGNYTLDCRNILPAYCDPVFMKQVWSNLIGNAFKYSSQKINPEITISSEIKNREILYCIRDNGAGFDEQYADKLFGVFQRLHKSTEFEGTGVGLAIVQRIINKHGGRVWAEGSPGIGAAFYFTLPGT
jgi:PAS domain S-box-containing protein